MWHGHLKLFTIIVSYYEHGHEVGQTAGDEGQGSLACCSPRGHEESVWPNNIMKMHIETKVKYHYIPT